jgi:hypothetical protein
MGFYHNLKSSPCFFSIRFICYQYTIGLVKTSTYPSPELMELSEPKPFGMYDQHERRIWNINPDFNNRSTYKNIYFSVLESRHNRLSFGRLHPPMKQHDVKFRKRFFKGILAEYR